MADVRPNPRQSQCEAANCDVNLPCIRQHPPASTLHPLCTAGIHVAVLLPWRELAKPPIHVLPLGGPMLTSLRPAHSMPTARTARTARSAPRGMDSPAPWACSQIEALPTVPDDQGRRPQPRTSRISTRQATANHRASQHSPVAAAPNATRPLRNTNTKTRGRPSTTSCSVGDVQRSSNTATTHWG
jgi:hypothetical protein